jgi:hypothetical protein
MPMHTFSFVLVSALILFYFILRVGIIRNSNLSWIQSNCKLENSLENTKCFNPGIWPWAENFPADSAEPSLASLVHGPGAAQAGSSPSPQRITDRAGSFLPQPKSQWNPIKTKPPSNWKAWRWSPTRARDHQPKIPINRWSLSQNFEENQSKP